MSEYSAVRGGQLKLKGKAGSQLKKKKSKRKRGYSLLDQEFAAGELKHGKWKKMKCLEDVTEKAIFETSGGGYLFAEDTGYFTVGDLRDEGDQPDPAEVFTVVRVTENRIALKSGYSRYVSVNSAGELIGRVEAIGPRETWEPVFEEGKMALCACTHRFVSAVKGKRLIAASEKARENEILSVYCDISSCSKKAKTEEEEEEELSGDITSFETNFVKKFQSGDKVRVCGDSRDGLKRAKEQGKLHEALLDRREKMKADRYCK